VHLYFWVFLCGTQYLATTLTDRAPLRHVRYAFAMSLLEITHHELLYTKTKICIIPPLPTPSARVWTHTVHDEHHHFSHVNYSCKPSLSMKLWIKWSDSFQKKTHANTHILYVQLYWNHMFLSL